MRKKAQAEGIRMEVDSAGTGNWHVGEPPCENAIRVAARHGLDISALRARQITAEDLTRFEYLVGLDAKNVADLEQMGAKNVRKLGDFGYDGADVPDPYFFDGFDGFEAVFEMIDRCTTNLLRHLAKN